ncbi:hypothetical protein QHH_29 [Halomonas phage QHHSV-1]|nr:hypothetical protein QHH_29 [Halomonas phage QHHSV-1]
MSANRQRLKSAIQRIAVEAPQIRDLLGKGKNKGGKASSAGVGTSEAEESRLCCDGSTSSAANPGTEERDPDSSSQDGLNSDDPARLESGDGTLSGVTDCATGEQVCFDGAGFIPPEGWDDPQSPPIDPTYTEGKYWRADDGGGSDVGFGATKQAAIDATSFARSDCVQCSNGAELIGRPLTANGQTSCPGTTILCDDGGYDGFDAYSVTQGDCTGSHAEESYCNPSEGDILSTDTWPSDGCTNLIIKDGAIVGSKYDPENDGSYSAPRDSIDLCDPENGARITLRASGQSDWKTIDAINGGDGYLYSGGKQIARVSGDEFTDPNV